MFQRLPIITVFLTLAVLAQTAPVKPERVLRTIIRKTTELADNEKEVLYPAVQQHPAQCLLSTAIIHQQDDSRLLVAIATTTDKTQKESARRMIEELIETKVNTLLCDTILDQLGLYKARRPRYDSVLGMMLTYSFSPSDNFPRIFIHETSCDALPVFITRLNDHDILNLFHKQENDPTDSAFNRNRLRNAIIKQITREMLGFLQQGKINRERLDDVQRCLDELTQIQEPQEKKPDNEKNTYSTIESLKDVATYCLLVSRANPADKQPNRQIVDIFYKIDNVNLPAPWYDILLDYAVNRPEDYKYLINKKATLFSNSFHQ